MVSPFLPTVLLAEAAHPPGATNGVIAAAVATAHRMMKGGGVRSVLLGRGRHGCDRISKAAITTCFLLRQVERGYLVGIGVPGLRG